MILDPKLAGPLGLVIEISLLKVCEPAMLERPFWSGKFTMRQKDVGSRACFRVRVEFRR